MYEQYQGKKEILLWSYISNGANESIGCRKRRSEDEGGPVTSKSRKDTADTITKIVEIFTKKHESNYSIEGLGSPYPNGET